MLLGYAKRRLSDSLKPPLLHRKIILWIGILVDSKFITLIQQFVPGITELRTIGYRQDEWTGNIIVFR